MVDKEETIELEGTIIEVLPNTMFRVEIANGHKILATLSGRMRRAYIRVTNGDKVLVDISPYDLNRGRITRRL